MHAPGQDDLVAFADAGGNVGLYIMSASGAHSEVDTQLSCAKGDVTEAFPLRYHLGNAPPDIGSSVEPHLAAPSLDALSAQVQAAIEQLGFDPRTATLNELVAHDLPARPNAPVTSAAYLSWLDVATSPISSIVRQGVATGHYHGPLMPSRVSPLCAGCGSYNASTRNWAGYAGYGYQGTFGLISAQWNMPTAVAQMPVGTYYDSTWVGIDGFSAAVPPHPPYPPDGTNVFQTGTWTQVSSNGGYQTAIFYIWYEWYPEPEQLAFYTAPKDSDWCEVFKYFSNGRATGEWYCKDQTSGQTEITSRYVDSAMIGATGEWIVERPEPNINNPGVFGPLVDFGSTTLINSWAQTTTGVWFPYSQIGGPWALYDITLVGSEGVDAATANASYLNFAVDYEHSL